MRRHNTEREEKGAHNIALKWRQHGADAVGAQHFDEKVAALKALHKLASTDANRESMWADDVLRTQLVACAASSEPAIVCEGAIAALASLALAAASIKEKMWVDRGLRTALLVGAASTEPGVRVQAFRALRNLAYAASNAQAMWADGNLRAALLAGAASTEPASVREQAIRALGNLAWAIENKKLMWTGIDSSLPNPAYPGVYRHMSCCL